MTNFKFLPPKCFLSFIEGSAIKCALSAISITSRKRKPGWCELKFQTCFVSGKHKNLPMSHYGLFVRYYRKISCDQTNKFWSNVAEHSVILLPWLYSSIHIKTSSNTKIPRVRITGDIKAPWGCVGAYDNNVIFLRIPVISTYVTENFIGCVPTETFELRLFGRSWARCKSSLTASKWPAIPYLPTLTVDKWQNSSGSPVLWSHVWTLFGGHQIPCLTTLLASKTSLCSAKTNNNNIDVPLALFCRKSARNVWNFLNCDLRAKSFQDLRAVKWVKIAMVEFSVLATANSFALICTTFKLVVWSRQFKI